jgi:hypothetical protein
MRPPRSDHIGPFNIVAMKERKLGFSWQTSSRQSLTLERHEQHQSFVADVSDFSTPTAFLHFFVAPARLFDPHQGM